MALCAAAFIFFTCLLPCGARDQDFSLAESTVLLQNHVKINVNAEVAGPSLLDPQVSFLLYQLWLPILVCLGMALHRLMKEPSGSSKVASHIPALSGLRFGIALLVYSEHTCLEPLSGGGSAFVMLSACILSVNQRRVLKPAMDADPSTECNHFLLHHPKEMLLFIFARLLRIYPLWFVAVTLTRVFRSNTLSYPSSAQDVALQPLVLAFTCAKTFVVLVAQEPRTVLLLDWSFTDTAWFLPVIVLMYVSFPFLEFLIFRLAASRRDLLVVAGVCCAVKLLILAAATAVLESGGFQVGDYWYKHDIFGVEVNWYTFPPFRLPDFVLGMLIPYLAVAVDDCPRSRVPVLTDIIAVCWLMFTFVVPQTRLTYLLIDLNVQCPLTAIFMSGLLFGPSGSYCAQTFSSWWCVELGAFGYGIYIFQEPLLRAVGLYYNSDASVSAACRLTNSCFAWLQYTSVQFLHVGIIFAVLVLLSWLGFHLVEDPSGRATRVCVKRCRAA